MTDLEIVQDCSADYTEQRKAAARIIFAKHYPTLHNKYFADMELIECYGGSDFSRIQTVKDKHVVAEWRLSPMPGCEAIMISSNVLVGFDCRKRGIGLLTTQMREEIAALAGYSMIMATTAAHNVIEGHILLTRNWQMMKEYGFYNYRNSHNVLVWTKELPNVQVNR